MPERDYPHEALTEEEARLRHADCELIAVFSIFDDDGERRPAIFVWRMESEAADRDPDAMYWLKL
ncbi:MAG: hypothetical protein ACRD3V_00505 [Vicinamibacteria bacterium]